MMTLLLSTGLASLLRAQTEADYKRFLTEGEGCSTVTYHDPCGRAGVYCVGIGHRLTPREMLRYGYGHEYSIPEINLLFDTDLTKALRTARLTIKGFSSLPPRAKELIVGVIWTTGATGFRRFHHFRAAMGDRYYLSASFELKASLWARQVGRARASQYDSTLRTLALRS